jgi:dTDP-glucose 4,6-dehydratase
VTVRPFNTYGPRQSARAVIPTIITQIADGRQTIKLGAIATTRDFSFIQDTVAGFIAALKSENGLGEVINLGSNFEISISETVQLIADSMGMIVEVNFDEERLRPKNSEVERLWADNTKAKELFNWKPTYTGRDGFQRGLAETIDWFTQFDNLRKYKLDIYNL